MNSEWQQFLHQYFADKYLLAESLRLADCIIQLDQWMSKNRLKLNADKTQLIWLGTRQQLAKLTMTRLRLTSSVVEFDSTVTDLGVVLDNQLSMQAQVAAVCRSCFYQLRQLRVVQRSLTRDVLQSLVQAFVHCRLDYCNAILTGAADGQIRRLQAVQNAAARLVSGARRRDSISPILRSLHWLPVRRRVIFKSAVIAWKCVNGVAPTYLRELYVPMEDVRGGPRLRSASTRCIFYCLGRRPLLDSAASRTAVLQCGTVCRQHCAKTCHWLHLRQN